MNRAIIVRKTMSDREKKKATLELFKWLGTLKYEDDEDIQEQLGSAFEKSLEIIKNMIKDLEKEQD